MNNLNANNAEHSTIAGGLLSNFDLRKRIIDVPEQQDKYLNLFKKRKWKELEKAFGSDYQQKFVIKDYNQLNLTPFSYDLSLGTEKFSIQKPDEGVRKYEMGQSYQVDPGETIIVITKELVAIPAAYAATVWPRFNMVRSGLFQSMVKIDPTWYGKLAIAMTNTSPASIELEPGKAFATLLLYELSKPSDVDLWKHDEIKDCEADINVPDTFHTILERLQEFLYDKSITRFVRLQDKTLKIVGLKRKHIETLMSFDNNSKWQDFVQKVANRWATYKHPRTGNRMIVMEAIGMDKLSDIIEGADYKKGRIHPEDLNGLICSQEELNNSAKQYGRPFDQVARLPKTWSDHVNKKLEGFEKEFSTRLESQIQGRIRMGVITLVLSMFGFLAVIVGVLALISQSDAVQNVTSPKFIVCGLITLGIISVVALLFHFTAGRK